MATLKKKRLQARQKRTSMSMGCATAQACEPTIAEAGVAAKREATKAKVRMMMRRCAEGSAETTLCLVSSLWKAHGGKLKKQTAAPTVFKNTETLDQCSL